VQAIEDAQAQPPEPPPAAQEPEPEPVAPPDLSGDVRTLCAAARRPELFEALIPLANAAGLEAVRKVLAVAPPASGIDNKHRTDDGQQQNARAAYPSAHDIYAARRRRITGA